MHDTTSSADVIVVGAGMAGLTAAGELARAGMSTIVLDKGRSPGGRMATRTIGGARFDHGAQHFSARSELFRARVGQLREAGIVTQWYEGKSRTTPGLGSEARLVGSGGMRRIPEHLAVGLDVRNSIAVDRLVVTGAGITAFAGKRSVAHAAAAILTPPVPQLLGLLRASDLRPGSDIVERLETVTYNPNLTVMASLDAPSGLPAGHLAQPAPDVAWLADNQHKGTSELPAVTIHSTADFARAHIEEDAEAWAQQLVAQAAPHLDGRVIAAKPHRWRYAEPRTTFDSGAIVIDLASPVVLAGEIFAGAKIEGAFLSGSAAADATLRHL